MKIHRIGLDDFNLFVNVERERLDQKILVRVSF